MAQRLSNFKRISLKKYINDKNAATPGLNIKRRCKQINYSKRIKLLRFTGRVWEHKIKQMQNGTEIIKF